MGEELKLAADVFAELEQLAGAAEGGLLKPEQVVSFARANPQSALHSHFEWNDSEAAEKYRLDQARTIIRAQVTVSRVAAVRCRAFVSVPSDRESGGGYRRTDTVLQSDRRSQLIECACKELTGFRTRYAYLPEMGPLFDRINAVVSEYLSGGGVTKVA